MNLNDLSSYTFPWNFVAWFAVFVSLLALIFLIGAIIDLIADLILWWRWRRDPIHRHQSRSRSHLHHDRDKFACRFYLPHWHFGPWIIWQKGK